MLATGPYSALYYKNQSSNKNLEAIFDSCLTFQSQNKTITQMGFFSQSTLL